MKKVIVIPVSILGVLIVGAGVFAYQMGAFVKIDVDNLPKFIQNDFIDLSKIGSISKFRSGIGHDFSANGETCRSMKHYFAPLRDAADIAARQQKDSNGQKALPPAPTPDTAIDIYSPVDGVIRSISQEHTPIGEQISIIPTGHRGYNIRLFHIYKVDGIKTGMHVTSGQKIGEISRLSDTDIAIEAGAMFKPTFVSYFDVMSDTVFAQYQTRGLANRSDAIFTREFRDAHPFTCNGEEFAQNYGATDQEVYLSGYVSEQELYNANNPQNGSR